MREGSIRVSRVFYTRMDATQPHFRYKSTKMQVRWVAEAEKRGFRSLHSLQGDQMSKTEHVVLTDTAGSALIVEVRPDVWESGPPDERGTYRGDHRIITKGNLKELSDQQLWDFAQEIIRLLNAKHGV